MATITLQGNEIHTIGDLPKVGESAPDFILVNSELNNVSLKDFEKKNIILNIIPSLDTPVCQKSTKLFNQKASDIDQTVILAVSADLPFAMKRFCSSENLDNITPLSMMRSRNFAKDYGVLIEDGPLAGITARAVIAINKENNVIYTQLVNEITDEPDYNSVLDSLK
ncbi:MAG: lipid hydroperoxide peroxidase [Gammaproteobacteria bacterium]|nr:lipid hydroperoxide peroxidase [Gammaproteobacteria bacterium]|tara:strand:+ start:377 stop:877 length:501 start_codon:yes stop_codon:yes gene_type:complete